MLGAEYQKKLSLAAFLGRLANNRAQFALQTAE